MRTQEEIVERIKERQKEDMFGFETSELVVYLAFDYARQFLKPEANKDEWEQETKTPAEKIKEYMPFAWDKANSCRGLSAGRSINHMEAWLWLDGKDELLPKMESEYEFYGKPCLVIVCQEYGIDWKSLDDGEWRNDSDGDFISASMALRNHGIKEKIKLLEVSK